MIILLNLLKIIGLTFQLKIVSLSLKKLRLKIYNLKFQNEKIRFSFY